MEKNDARDRGKFSSRVDERKSDCSNSRIIYSSRVISIKSRNGMTQTEIYQKMLSFSKK